GVGVTKCGSWSPRARAITSTRVPPISAVSARSVGSVHTTRTFLSAPKLAVTATASARAAMILRYIENSFIYQALRMARRAKSCCHLPQGLRIDHSFAKDAVRHLFTQNGSGG